MVQASIRVSIHQSPSGSGFREDGYFDDPIIVRLTSNESAAFGKNEVNVVDLAEQVLTYWKAQSIA